MTSIQDCRRPLLRDESLIPATLHTVCRCPARLDYIELCFETDEGTWTWCIPNTPERPGRASSGRALAMTVGTYGARARYVEDGGLGFALPTSDAVPMILGGSATYVARKLVERGW